MNYYEELGLAPDSADEDIRRAHRTLSKVLHPDRQTDPAAREAAELQMRRVNAIVGSLLDPDLRREYDASLRVFPRPYERQGPGRRRFGGPLAALLSTVSAAVVLTGAAVWFLDGDLLYFETPGNRAATRPENRAPSTPRQPVRAAHTAAHLAAPAVPANGPVAGLSRKAARSGKPPHASVPAPVMRPPQPAAPSPQPVREPPVVGSLTEAPAPAATVLTRQEVPSTTASTRAALPGLWLYAPDPRESGPTRLYAPEYIQLRIREEDGVVRGEYAARYQVLDRPISAEVAFRFEGTAGGAGSFEWRSDDGSHGMVDLRMLTAESLQVNWRVNRFGTRLGLGAGKAVLTRKIDRNDPASR